MSDFKNKQPSPRPIKINLPLAVFGHDDVTKTLKQKLFLIDKFKLTDIKILIELLKKKVTGQLQLESTEKLMLEKIWKSAELDDLDLTELFVSALPTFIDKISPKFLEMMDPMPWFHKNECADNYDDFMKEAGKRASKAVARFALPRVRAKLALQEVICSITADQKLLSKLIERTPRYLACPRTADWLCKFKIGANLYKNEKALEGFKLISNAVRANPKIQPRKYGYWQLEYYFFEVVSCLKTLNSIDDKIKHRSYANDIVVFWGIPNHYKTNLEGIIKNPTELTLSIMIDKGMIEDASSYRNVIMPYVKRMKAKYPSIRACNPVVEKLLDLPTKAPTFFGKFEIYKQLESFEFDLNEKELKVGHAISHPTYAVRV